MAAYKLVMSTSEDGLRAARYLYKLDLSDEGHVIVLLEQRSSFPDGRTVGELIQANLETVSNTNLHQITLIRKEAPENEYSVLMKDIIKSIKLAILFYW